MCFSLFALFYNVSFCWGSLLLGLPSYFISYKTGPSLMFHNGCLYEEDRNPWSALLDVKIPPNTKIQETFLFLKKTKNKKNLIISLWLRCVCIVRVVVYCESGCVLGFGGTPGVGWWGVGRPNANPQVKSHYSTVEKRTGFETRGSDLNPASFSLAVGKASDFEKVNAPCWPLVYHLQRGG